MTDHQEENTSTVVQMKPYLLAAGILLIIVLAIFLWPSKQGSNQDTTSQSNPPAQIQAPLSTDENQELRPEQPKPQVFEPTPEPVAVVLETNPSEADENLDIIGDVEPEPIVDESDGAVKRALMKIASSPRFASLLVNESLLQKFVVNVYNMANGEAAPNHSLLTPPAQKFEIYQQADRQWIDPRSYQRYNVYVDVLSSMPSENLLELLNTYKPSINQIFAEIAPPNASFDATLLAAINELLDTPKSPVPIEVFSESVMYKFKDPKLESLSAPQKQLLRTGPENMRKIKQVLRELKQSL